MTTRSTRQVFEDHLQLRADGNLDEDLRRNYSEDVIVLTVNSVLRGQEDVRYSAARLREQLPNARYEYVAKAVEGELAFLVWRAESGRLRVECGADTFVIRDGRIVMQTIHYHLLERS